MTKKTVLPIPAAPAPKALKPLHKDFAHLSNSPIEDEGNELDQDQTFEPIVPTTAKKKAPKAVKTPPLPPAATPHKAVPMSGNSAPVSDVTPNEESASTGAEYELCSWFLRLEENEIPFAQSLTLRIAPSDFADSLFGKIYEAAHHFIKQGKVSGAAAILSYAHEHELPISAEDLSAIASDTLSQITDNERLQQNVDIILEHAQRRALRHVLLKSIESLNNHTAIDTAQHLAQKLGEFAQLGSTHNEAEHISTLMDNVIEGLAQDEDQSTQVMATGFTDLDAATGGGLRNGDFIVLAGRPSMGKTGFALNMGRNVSMDTRHFNNVLFYSLEMTGESLATRLLSAESAIPAQMLRVGGDEIFSNTGYINALSEVLPRFAAHNEHAPHVSRLWIDDQSGLTVSQIVARTKEFVRKHGKSLVIIDYLQFISTSDLRNMTRVEQVSTISKTLKTLAREIDCPVIALSQLSRELEKRMDKRPIMSDLRESGAIEQDADLILFVYRDVVYNPNAEDPSHAEIIIGKQREGELKTIDVTFSGQYVRFSNRVYID